MPIIEVSELVKAADAILDLQEEINLDAQVAAENEEVAASAVSKARKRASMFLPSFPKMPSRRKSTAKKPSQVAVKKESELKSNRSALVNNLKTEELSGNISLPNILTILKASEEASKEDKKAIAVKLYKHLIAYAKLEIDEIFRIPALQFSRAEMEMRNAYLASLKDIFDSIERNPLKVPDFKPLVQCINDYYPLFTALAHLTETLDEHKVYQNGYEVEDELGNVSVIPNGDEGIKDIDKATIELKGGERLKVLGFTIILVDDERIEELDKAISTYLDEFAQFSIANPLDAFKLLLENRRSENRIYDSVYEKTKVFDKLADEERYEGTSIQQLSLNLIAMSYCRSLLQAPIEPTYTLVRHLRDFLMKIGDILHPDDNPVLYLKENLGSYIMNQDISFSDKNEYLDELKKNKIIGTGSDLERALIAALIAREQCITIAENIQELQKGKPKFRSFVPKTYNSPNQNDNEVLDQWIKFKKSTFTSGAVVDKKSESICNAVINFLKARINYNELRNSYRPSSSGGSQSSML